MQQATFRAAMEAGKKGDKMADGSIDDRILCKYCGRKFRADVAIKHIPICPKNRR